MNERLAQRSNWQRMANAAGSGGEKLIVLMAKTLFLDCDTYEVSTQLVIPIYPNGRGIRPDCVIAHKATSKKALIEVKRQGAQGNAHERLCRNYMPGIQEKLQQICGFLYPVFTICLDGLVGDKHKNQEITEWFDHDSIRNRLLMWNGEDPEVLITFFTENVLPNLQE